MTLSVVLPVYNAQGIVGPLIGELLEMAAELTPRFELLVVNDGSTDATPEMLTELASDYPQLALLHLPAHAGASVAWRTGLARIGGEWALMCDLDCPAYAFDLPKLWQAASHHELVAARMSTARGTKWMPRLAGRAGAATWQRPAMLLVRRSLALGWLDRPQVEELTSYLARRGHVPFEVEVRSRLAVGSGARLDGPASTLAPKLAGTAPESASASGPKTPNYLARLRAFALGQ